ncbi:hypothetical protein [Pontiella sp.]|uniref:hypothetical protein n=1 Tax=Pontiella sp. TaxID=2837462 RepID=UPI00356B3D4E
MNVMNSLVLMGCAALLAGCATSSQVQEMIDASHRDYLTKVEAHDASIDVLKKSAMTGLEKSKENGAQLAELQVTMEKVLEELKIVKGYAEASKLMSAANTVKLNGLDGRLSANEKQDQAMKDELSAFDRLYENVMLDHYQRVADSAHAVIEALKAEGCLASTNAPVNLDKPIEIVAPNPAAATVGKAPAAE